MNSLEQAIQEKQKLRKQMEEECRIICASYNPRLTILDRIIKEARKKGIGKRVKQYLQR